MESYNNFEKIVFCRSCGNQITSGDKFCRRCGAFQNSVIQPVVQPTRASSVKGKVFGGIGFGLSIFGFVISLFCLLMIFVTVDAVYYDYYEGVEFALFCLVYSILFIEYSIVGLIFSSMARKDGNTSGLTATGKIFGIIGIIVFAFTFIIGISVFCMY